MTARWMSAGRKSYLPRAFRIAKISWVLPLTLSMPKNSGYGLAVVSATLPDGFQGFSFAYNRKGGIWLTNKSIDMVREQYAHKIRSDFQSEFGKVFILRLRAGPYQFIDWAAGAGLYTYWRPVGIHPMPFNVAAGRAVYLGGLDPIEVGKVLELDDQARDLPVFFEKCPGFDHDLLGTRVMDGTPWQ